MGKEVGIVLEVLTSNQEKRNKSHPGGKERSKLSLFADNMVLYIENLDKKRVSRIYKEFSMIKIQLKMDKGSE